MPVATTPDGVEISYHDLGGSGPPLLFVHATGFHGRMWGPVAELLQSDFRMWALDLRGHGDSAAPPALDFSWPGFGLDVRTVVSELGLEQPYGAGHSLGGSSLLMAEQQAPGTFRSLWVFEPAVCRGSEADRESGVVSSQLAARRRDVFPSRAAARANYAGKAPMSDFAAEVLEIYVTDGFADLPNGDVRLKCPPAFESATFAGYADSDVFERMPEIGCPVTVAYGADEPSASDTATAFTDRLKRSRLDRLPGLNHFGPQQSPALIAESLRGMLTNEAMASQ